MVRRSWLPDALTAVGGLTVAFLFLEAVTRLQGAGPEPIPFRRVEVWDDGAFWPVDVWSTAFLKRESPYGTKAGEYLPGLRFRFVYPGNPRGYFDADGAVEARVNSSGLRGPEFEPRKKPGTFRILGLGDSFTFGEGVRLEDTFLARLEKALDASAASLKFEVINAGVSSSDTADEVTYLDRAGVELEPDLVLITFVLNDAYDESLFGPLHKGYLTGRIRLAQERTMWGSRLLALAYDRWLRWDAGRRTARLYESQFSGDPLLPGNSWEDCRLALARAAELGRERGFGLALILFPELYRLDGRYPFLGAHEMVRREAEQLGIPTLDLLEAFRGREDSALWVHPADHHPNEEAHRIAAAAILAFLRGPRFRLPAGSP